MTPEEENALKIAIATRAAETIISTLDASGVQRDVQIEAVLAALGTLMLRNVKPQHCLMIYNAASMRLREKLKIALKGGKKNASH